jgi:hypothetical protein
MLNPESDKQVLPTIKYLALETHAMFVCATLLQRKSRTTRRGPIEKLALEA